MADTIATQAYSFPQGTDRSVEQRMFHGWYAQNVHKPIPVGKVMARFTSMMMMGDAVNVLASAITFAGIQQIVHQLPYDLVVAANKVSGPFHSIDSAVAFYAIAIKELLGMTVIKNVADGDGTVWVVVDPHLLDRHVRGQLAQSLKNQLVLMILPINERVPEELRSISIAGKNEVYPVDACAPFAQPSLEEALLRHGVRRYTVIGAGQRLLPTMIGVCDTVLQNTHIPGGKCTNAIRRQIVSQYVRYLPFGIGLTPWCEFDSSWYQHQTTFMSALFQYLRSFGIGTMELQHNAQNPDRAVGEFVIAPYWQLA